MLKFYGYKRCDTCRKALSWLKKWNLEWEEIDITLNPPTSFELKSLLRKSGASVKDFLNRSGESYRALNMKEKLKTLTEEKILSLMAKDGRLIKRPIVTDGTSVTVGFDEKKFRLWR